MYLQLHPDSVWGSFWPDVLVAFIGAIFTVAIAVGSYVLNQRRIEASALRSLVSELHLRRSLAPAPNPRVIPGAKKLDDYRFAIESVLSIRDEVRRTRDLIRSDEELQSTLIGMTTACNRYLEISSARPDEYVLSLEALRNELSEGVLNISRLRRSVAPKEPGKKAY